MSINGKKNEDFVGLEPIEELLNYRSVLPPEIDEVLEDIEFDDFRTRTPSRCANILRGYIIAQAEEISELRKGANCPVYGSEDPCVYAELLEAYEAEHEAVGQFIVNYDDFAEFNIVATAHDHAERVR